MQHLEVSGAVRYIYIYIIRRLKVKSLGQTILPLSRADCPSGSLNLLETPDFIEASRRIAVHLPCPGPRSMTCI